MTSALEKREWRLDHFGWVIVSWFGFQRLCGSLIENVKIYFDFIQNFGGGSLAFEFFKWCHWECREFQ